MKAISCMVRRFFTVIFIVFLPKSISIAQKFDWAYGTGTWVEDYATKIIIADNGFSYATGYVSGGAVFGDFENETWAVFVVKLDPQGKIVWANFGEGGGTAVGTDLALDKEGNVLVTGYFTYSLKFDDIALAGAHQTKAFLAQLNSSGQARWVKALGTIASASWDAASALAVDQQDNVYVTGRYSQTFLLESGGDLGDPYPHYWPDTDIFLLKYDKNGTLAWGKRAGTFYGDDYAMSIKINPLNQVLLHVILNSNKFTYDTNPEVSFPFTQEVYYWSIEGHAMGSLILTLDTNGKLLHTLSFDGFATSFDIHDDGSLVVAGDFYQTIKIGANNFFSDGLGDNTDGFLASYSAAGNLIWAKKVASTGMRIAVYKKDIFMTGRMLWAPGIIDGINIGQGLIVSKFNAHGYMQWVREFPHREISQILSLDVSSTGQIGISGEYTLTQLNLDGIILNNNSGNSDPDLILASIIDDSPPRCPVLTATINLDKTQMCAGDLATLQAASEGYPVSWFNNGAWVADTDAGPWQTSHGGDFYFTINAGAGCDYQSAAVHLHVIDVPQLQIASNPGTVSCDNAPVALSISGTADPYRYQWFKDGLLLPDQTQAHLTASTTGTYKVIATNNGLCPGEATQHIAIIPTETDFLPDTVFHCNGSPLTLAPAVQYTEWSFQWSSGETTSAISFQEDGIYTLTLSYDNCTSVDQVALVSLPALQYPNVVTANNDGKNDSFIIENPPGTLVDLRIVDRWGKPVFESNNYRGSWPPAEIPTGVYYFTFTVNATAANGCDDKKKGWVHVLGGE